MKKLKIGDRVTILVDGIRRTGPIVRGPNEDGGVIIHLNGIDLYGKVVEKYKSENKLGLKSCKFFQLKVGQSVIIGPYKKSATASGKMSQVRKKYPELMEGREFTQVQWLLVSPSTLETLKMYLVTRTK